MIRFLFVLVLMPIAISSMGCFSYSYTVKENQKTVDTKTEMVTYTLAWMAPPTRTVEAYEICPSKKVNEVILYDSGLDATLCVVTLFLYCPKTIKVSCYE